MECLEEIKNKVQQKLNQKHNQIIIEYYKILIKKHNDFCSCNYCSILKDYVQLKKYKTRYLRNYESIEFDSLRLEEEYFNNYRTIDSRVKELKKTKDKLKSI